jgi:Galactose oxidase, central domain
LSFAQEGSAEGNYAGSTPGKVHTKKKRLMSASPLHAGSSVGSSGGMGVVCWPPYCDGTGTVIPASEKYFRAGMSCDLVMTKSAQGLFVCGTYSEPFSAFFLSNVKKVATDETACEWTRYDMRDCGLQEPRVGHATARLPSSADGSTLLLHGGYHGHERKNVPGRVDRSVFGDSYKVSLSEGKDEAPPTIKVEQVRGLAPQNIPDVERRWHCAFTAGSKTFFHGGWNEFGAVGSMIALDPEKPAWEVIDSAGDVPRERRWHTMTPFADGGEQQLLFGGYYGDPNEPMSDTVIFDVNRGFWTAVPARGDAPDGRFVWGHLSVFCAVWSVFLVVARPPPPCFSFSFCFCFFS